MNDSLPVILGLSSFLLFAIVYVWLALALAALFRKVGEESWKGWVPLLNMATVLKLGGFSPWLVLLGLIPIANIAYVVFHIVAIYRISRGFGSGAGMTVLGALFFVIWASILGFGSARWVGAAPAPVAGPMRTGAASAPAYEPAPPTIANPTLAAAGYPPAPPATPATLGPAPVAASGPAAWAPPAPDAAGQPAPAASAAPPAPAPAASSSAFPPPPPPQPSPVTYPLDDGLEDSAVDPEDRIPAPASRIGSFTPPPAPAPAPAAPAAPPTPIASVPGVRASTPAPHADAPVTDVPPPPPPAPVAEPWAPVAPDESFPEPSEAVSAVAGAPDAGSPRSARSSVSALYAQPEIPAEVDDEPDDLDGLDQTVIAKRRRIPWALVPPGGTPIELSSDVVILGRRPAADPAHPGAQLVSISDETRTVSKTHARLELRGETWYVTDLGSTNGVLFATLMGTEVEAQPGQEIEAGERFFLGDAEVRLARSEG